MTRLSDYLDVHAQVMEMATSLKRFAALPFKIARWAVKGQLVNRIQISRWYKLLASSGLFDRDHYLSQHPKLSNPEADVLGHYLTTGGFQGLDPNPLFDSAWYLRTNPDVANSGLNPLVHFIQSGAEESRNPHPLFDVTRYRCSDENLSKAHALRHYLERGAREGCQPHLLFDAEWYLQEYASLAGAATNPLVHYLLEGWRNHLSPHPLFDSNYYLEQNRDVAEAGVNPLLHYVQSGSEEKRNPNPLFDTSYYLSKHAELLPANADALMDYVSAEIRTSRQPHPLFDPGYYLAGAPNAVNCRTLLEHYFLKGHKLALSPHALFDADYYLAQARDLGEINNPVAHYIEIGAEMGLDPCELFDTSYYLEQYPGVQASGQNPLIHFLLIGSKNGCNPNPLFDTVFYLKRYPDVAASDTNPLVHYIESGAFEGRIPSPFFDSLFYLRQNPGLRRARINPLAHYLRYGATDDGKDPNAFFNNSKYLDEHSELRETGVIPLVHFLTSEDKSKQMDPVHTAKDESQPNPILRCRSLGTIPDAAYPDNNARTLICLSHISPVPPCAGNEYRLNRLLKKLQADGYELVNIVSPLPGHVIADDQIRDLAHEFGTAIHCDRNGLITHLATEDKAHVISLLDGTPVPDINSLLSENDASTSRQRELLEVDRSFCHNSLAYLVQHITKAYQHCTLLAEYVFMTRVFPLVDKDVFKVIDTHDVFSSKAEKVVAFGVSDSLSMSAEEERAHLLRADLIIAIQDEERQKLIALVNDASKVVTAGVDFPTISDSLPPPSKPAVVCIGSENAMNAWGLQQFLQLVWPTIIRSLPGAQLIVAGGICKSVRSAHPSIRLLGFVDDIQDLYQTAQVVINPVLAGTGLKIKTLEALSHFRRIVTWPTGIEGMDTRLSSKCSVARDWFEFGQMIINFLNHPEAAKFTEEDKLEIRLLLSSEHVYQALEQRLSIDGQQLKLSRA